jgi:hypothetical protein
MLLIHCTIDLAFGIFFIFFSELCLTALRSQSFTIYLSASGRHYLAFLNGFY